MKRSIILAVLLSVLAFGLVVYAAKPTPPPPEIAALADIQNTEGIVDPAALDTWYDVVTLAGPGKFASAMLWMHQGNGEMEFWIDGNRILKFDFLDQATNHFHIANGSHHTYISTSDFHSDRVVSIQFPYPIAFTESLVLKAKVTYETIPVVIQGNVIWGQ